MGNSAYGTDLEPRMISYARENLEWLASGQTALPSHTLAVGDATDYEWEQPVGSVACETYLGRAFTDKPSPDILMQTVGDVNLIVKKFLQNIHGQLAPGTRLCVAVPAWQTAPNLFRHLPLVDQLQDLGYNRISFEHVRDEQLLYYREDQTVARQLLVLEKAK
jgi:tRNA G10  N-methylase Trm11